uniref:Uncharacterized protein n=1 Tax=Rhizophora mucronata TaxID=61149 RepID=A0A2P2IKS2_RHIMU
MFNHMHSSLRSCIKRTFGLWKRRWRILYLRPCYSFHMQKDIVIASKTLYNYIH